MNGNPLTQIINKHKAGASIGIYAVCSANPFVLKAALQQAKQDNSFLLVEATSNQVDQFGGYTGMTPAAFKKMVTDLALQINFEPRALLFGGDHLGPNRWRQTANLKAMEWAKEQIKTYLKAGFIKIHLDTTMPLEGDYTDSAGRLPIEIVAQRAAELCKVAENTFKHLKQKSLQPLYVIGSDVPIPGGAQQKLNTVHVTPVSEVKTTIAVTFEAFKKAGLEDVWPRVKAIVVQPGVEFDQQHVFDYQPQKVSALRQFIETEKQFVYEAHSTDYQLVTSLKQLVEDHFVILKVGPALTFAFREALFALAFIEKELSNLHKSLQPSQLLEITDQIMTKMPQHWQNHYKGNKAELHFARLFSFSDRIRYYWSQKEIQLAINRLFNNLQKYAIPLTLLSQFLPDEFKSVRKGLISNEPETLVLHKIQTVLRDYAFATQLADSLHLMTEKHDQLTMEQA